MMSSEQSTIDDKHRIQVKLLKKELKAWEHQFLNDNGRKPDKQDIAGHLDMAKKYKHYARLKIALNKADVEESTYPSVEHLNQSKHILQQRSTVPSGKAMHKTAQNHKPSILDITEPLHAAVQSLAAVNTPPLLCDGKAPEVLARQSFAKQTTKPPMLDTSNRIASTVTGGSSISSGQTEPAPSPPVIPNWHNNSMMFNTKVSSGVSAAAVSTRINNKNTVASGAMTTADLGRNTNKFTNRVQQQLARNSMGEQQTDMQNSTVGISPKTKDWSNTMYKQLATDNDIMDMFSNVPGYSISGPQENDDDLLGNKTHTGGIGDTQMQEFMSRRQQIMGIKDALVPPLNKSMEYVPVPSQHAAPVDIKASGGSSTKFNTPAPQTLQPTPATITVMDQDSKSAKSNSLPKSSISLNGSNSDSSLPPLPSKRNDKLCLSLTHSNDLQIGVSDGFVKPTARAGWGDPSLVDDTIRPLSGSSANASNMFLSADAPVNPITTLASASSSQDLRPISTAALEDEIVPIEITPTNRSTDSSNDATALTTSSTAFNISQLPSLTTTQFFQRLSKEGVLRCRLLRKKNMLDKANPTYLLYNEVENTFMLSGKKKLISKSISYIILDSQENLSKDSPHYLAKLKGNFKRNSFIMTDTRGTIKNRELSHISYTKNVLPRELQVAISAPMIAEDAGYSTDIMADVKSKNVNKLLFLKNKPPKWNEATQSHCLNFGGRVTQPSIKNMQLIAENDENHIVLQFGRCGPDLFTLDVRWPMTPIEAFVIALTTFDVYDSN
ncbi:hypothetical protein BASA83_009109 [Batrachochytrium salamandrivorans]|nr:hypothetical protein BASA83_009109 [Batrachochytrium salamandrivorans]